MVLALDGDDPALLKLKEVRQPVHALLRHLDLVAHACARGWSGGGIVVGGTTGGGRLIKFNGVKIERYFADIGYMHVACIACGKHIALVACRVGLTLRVQQWAPGLHF